MLTLEQKQSLKARLGKDLSPERTRPDDVRDLGRIIHSASFRRLQNKTQVLGVGESDFYRTRLTHSLEVAQIGRGIVRHLEEKVDEEIAKILPSETQIEAICLVHDIGHPPFGHGGEIALNYCAGSIGFEGNGQSLRVLTKLDKQSKENGLDLSKRTLLGVLKYPINFEKANNNQSFDTTPFKNPIIEKKRFTPPKCYFGNEDELVRDFILTLSADKGDFDKFTDFELDEDDHFNVAKYKSLDATIMDLADDISYGIHDIEDAISIGKLTREMFVGEISEHIYKQATRNKNTGKNYSQICDGLFGGESYKRKNIVGHLVDLFITSVSVEHNGSGCQHALLRYKACWDEDLEVLINGLQKLVRKYIIKSKGIQHLEFKGQKIIIELYTAFSTDPKRLLPDDFYSQFYKPAMDREDTKEQVRAIIDYIAGFSDTYALRMYERLFMPNKGSFFESI